MRHETKNINEIALEFSGGKTLEQLREQQDRRTTATPAAGNSEAAAEYWSRVFSTQRRSSSVLMMPPLTQEVDFETARTEFRELIKDRAIEIGLAKNCDYKITLSEDQGAVVVTLLKWLINDPTCPIDLAKGWWLYGEPGTFKTELARLLQRYAEKRGLSKLYRFTDWSHEYDIAQMDTGFDIIQHNEQFARCFDEFGRKSMPISRFGNKIDANESVIEARYSRFKKYRQFTMFVSNYDPKQIQTILSPMAFDRLTEMVTSIRMPGTSNRNAKPDHL